MSSKKHNTKLDYEHSLIDIDKIDTSSFQVRKYFDQDKQRELAESIKRDRLLLRGPGSLNAKAPPWPRPGLQ